jgi:hypothetical protein
MACAMDDTCRTEAPFEVFMRLVMTFVMLQVSIGIQLCLLYLFYTTTLENKEDPYEPAQLEPKEELLAAVLNAQVPLNITGSTLAKDTLTLCIRDKTLPGSHLLMIFIWLTKMSMEFDDCFKRFKGCWRAPLQDDVIVSIDPETDKHTIVSMSSMLRVLCILLLCIPQFFIACVTSFVGVKFLTFALDMGSLIMKALSLGFIVTIDEVIYTVFAPKVFKKLLKDTKLWEDRNIWYADCLSGENLGESLKGWLGTLLWGAGILFFTFFLYEGPFHELMSFKKQCHEYFLRYPEHTPDCPTCGFQWNPILAINALMHGNATVE